MKKFFGEFKKFITRGNVMDMAVGTIVGAAFTAIVTALSNGILKPIINTIIYYCCGGNTEALSKMYTPLVKVMTEDAEGNLVMDMTKSIYIDWGAFISAIINFLLIALVLFCIVRAFNKVKDANEGLKDRMARIEYKQSKGMKLTKKEKAILAEAEEAKKKAEAEAAEKARLAEEEANKLTRSEQLLTEIKELLAKK